MNKQSSILTAQVVKDSISYILGGGFRLNDAHLPRPNCTVPDDFFGVGVASNPNPATDDYIIQQLRVLGVLQVRLDLSYSDITSFQGRFCNALIDAGFAITLRLIPPFESAKHMHLADEQAKWQSFIEEVITCYLVSV
jgi:hypothetical protein